jgi:hypothetical protein
MLLPVPVEHAYLKLDLYLMIFFIQLIQQLVLTLKFFFCHFLTNHFSFIDNVTSSAFAMPDSMDIETLAQPPDKATYAEQANKRTHCRRLTK